MMQHALMYALMLAMAVGVASAAVAVPQPGAPATQPALEELRPILSPQARGEAARKLIDRFVAHLAISGTFDAPAVKAVSEAWQRHRSDDEPQEFLTAAVAIVSAQFKEALTAMDQEDYPLAEKLLRPLADAKDPYLSLHAAALLARSLVEQDKLEEAEAALTPLAEREKELMEKTFLEAEVDFLLGYCQLANLRYDQARRTLETFMQQHPDAPDRFLLPARQMLQELRVRQPESLGEVSDLMTYAGRRLGNGQSDQPVQLKQKRAVELLGKLIEEAQEREKQSQQCKNCGGKGCQKCRGGGAPSGNRPPGSPAERSTLPGGKGRIGELHASPTARPGEAWGELRPEQRRRILQSLGQDFPARYRQLVEQYYKQLGKEQ